MLYLVTVLGAKALPGLHTSSYQSMLGKQIKSACVGLNAMPAVHPGRGGCAQSHLDH